MAILGLGSDLVAIARVERAWARHGQAFPDRILTAIEQEEGTHRGYGAHFLAGRFAAKEAAAKALGTGLAEGVRLGDLEVVPSSRGVPALAFHGTAAEQATELGVLRSHLTISHDGGFALATVLLEG